MLATIYGREQDFGTRVTPENIASIYARLVAQREQFLATADWLYTDLRALAAPMPAVR